MNRILLIEDDSALRENTAELLELSGYEVITAPNGKDGLMKIREIVPDIIVCDIMMPELDGYGVLRALQKEEHTQYIPFIFLSAKTEHKEIRKGMDLGADDYITKPFEESELVSAIESRLAKAAILREYRETQQRSGDKNNGNIMSLHQLKNYIDDYGEEYTCAKDETIYQEGYHANKIYLIKRGVVKTHKTDEYGKELITALYNDDDLFGYTSFTQNIPHRESATAVKKTLLTTIGKQELRQILEKNHNITLELIQLLTDDLSEIKDQLLQMAYGSVRKKTAVTILQFIEKLRKKPQEAIKISRNDLAGVAGIATESLIRTLSSFKKEGLIAIEGRNIKILNISGLQKIS